MADCEPTVSCQWSLANASIIGISERGPAYQESGVSLEIVEGRHIQMHPLDDDYRMREVWDYRLDFSLKDAIDPDNSSQVECLLSITGALIDGRVCKIHGQGFIGRDNHGQIEGSFFAPPRIEIAEQEDNLVVWDRPGDDD